MGCENEVFAPATSTTGVQSPVSCPQTFAPVTTVAPGTVYVVFDPGTPQNQAAAITKITAVTCTDKTKVYNAFTDTCG
jgi:hypothetical protein